MLDRYLLRIAEAADAGQTVPWLKVFTPALVITGYPASQRAFVEEFESSDAVHLYGARMPEKSNRRWRRSDLDQEDERAWREAQEQAAARAGPLSDVAQESPEALCMTDAAGFFADGTHVAFDCIRIPFGSICAWTTGQQEVLSEPSSGGWFVGGAFSLPTD